MEILRDILTNIIVLFGLVLIFNLSNSTFKHKNIYYKILMGISIGIITIIIMVNALETTPGVIFDTRSILISVTALFFPFTTSFIATVIAIIYRIYIGGSGVYAGVLTLLTSFLIGIIWKKYFYPKRKINEYLFFYIFGVIVHIVMLLCQLTIPYPENIDVLINLGPIILLTFPLAVMLLSKVILNNNNRINAQELIKKSEIKYRTLINNTKLGIIQFNLNGVIEIANQAYADILNVDRYKVIGFNLTELPNKPLVDSIQNTLKGNYVVLEDNYTSFLSNKTFPARIQLSPILVDNKIIGGIGIIEDLTNYKKMQKNIEKLQNKDILTNIYNRAAFDKFLYTNPYKLTYPVSIVTCGINTFRAINTSFGYDVGNQVLIKIASILRNITKERVNFKAYRIGGDEFALTLQNTTYEEACNITSKVQDMIKNTKKFKFKISFSCGISTTDSNKISLTDTFNNALERMMSNKIYDGSSMSTKTVDLIMNTLYEKNEREELHSERVSQISRKIAEKFNLGTAFDNRVEMAGKLHDIGKITISEEILEKPGKLTDKEWIQIKKHPETGFRILSSVPEYLDIANIILAHHERYDGKGYPRGLKENESPLEARIICVADAFDAMIVSRPYRKGMSIEKAIQEIKDNSGTQFDPYVVEKMLELYKENKL